MILHKANITVSEFPPTGTVADSAPNTAPDDAPSTVFAHRYSADGTRHQTLLRRAPTIPAAAIPVSWHDVDILHVAPVLDEVSAVTVAAVSAGFVGLTAQGFMREAPIGRPVRPKMPTVPEALLERAHGIVVSTEDIAAAPDWPGRVARPGRWVAVTDGPRGAILFIGGRRIHQPAFRAQSIDPTGAGDIFAAALFIQMAEGVAPDQALRFAAAAGAWSVGFRADDPRVAPSHNAVREVLLRTESGPAHER
jgi:sugar/nucleoside kinase (ribokinase family)